LSSNVYCCLLLGSGRQVVEAKAAQPAKPHRTHRGSSSSMSFGRFDSNSSLSFGRFGLSCSAHALAHTAKAGLHFACQVTRALCNRQDCVRPGCWHVCTDVRGFCALIAMYLQAMPSLAVLCCVSWLCAGGRAACVCVYCVKRNMQHTTCLPQPVLVRLVVWSLGCQRVT
jgi:hypothetical protein